MKFTRFYILKALNLKENNINNSSDVNNQNPVEVFKEIIISHPNVDLTLALILSLILYITKLNDDVNFIYSNSMNIYLVTIINIMVLIGYFSVEYFDKLLTNPNSDKGQNNRNSQNNNPFNNNSNNVPLLNSNLNVNITENNKLKIPLALFNNWHAIKSLLHLVKIFLSINSYFLSLIFCVLYTGQKFKIDKEKYFMIHLLVLDFYEFYSGFRVCYFLIKIFINICLLPVYISSVILGVLDDNFNKKLNILISTKLYAGRNSIPKTSRVSDLEEYCSICLNSFQIDEVISTLPCSKRHTFHTSCLEKWFITTVQCPLCRSDFHNNIDLFGQRNNEMENRNIV